MKVIFTENICLYGILVREDDILDVDTSGSSRYIYVGSTKYDLDNLWEYFEVYDDTNDKVFELLRLEKGKIYEFRGIRYRIFNNEIQLFNFDGWDESYLDFNSVINGGLKEINPPFEEIIEVGDKYYIIGADCMVYSDTYGANRLDRNRIQVNNFFETEIEAMEARGKVTNTLKEFKDEKTNT
jgi:hypothetical protein